MPDPAAPDDGSPTVPGEEFGRYADRRRVAFDRHLRGFTDQFRDWKERTETPPWAAHYSQVRAIEALLLGVCETIRAKADTGGNRAGKEFLENLAGLELAVLSGWRVWEFFRAKFAQRLEEQFLPGLRAADELAWFCWQPFAEAAVRAGTVLPKEPPLVYLSGNASPVALARGDRFTAESAPGMGKLDETCARLLARVPLPLISLPWHEVWHAPGLCAVAHETGHVIETDYGLAGELDDALAGAIPGAALPRWQPWRGEIFADFLAVRACGPGYVGLLADVLRDTSPNPLLYPPNGLRMELCFAGLRALGLNAEADSRRERWGQLSPAAPPSPDDALADAVVNALATRPVATLGQSLDKLVSFGPAELASAQSVADQLEDGQRPDRDPGMTLSPPVVAAAVRLLYERDPGLFGDGSLSLDCFDLITRKRPGQRRGGPARVTGPALSDAQMRGAIRAAADDLLAHAGLG